MRLKYSRPPFLDIKNRTQESFLHRDGLGSLWNSQQNNLYVFPHMVLYCFTETVS